MRLPKSNKVLVSCEQDLLSYPMPNHDVSLPRNRVLTKIIFRSSVVKPVFYCQLCSIFSNFYKIRAPKNFF